jgi:hypothetical protein
MPSGPTKGALRSTMSSVCSKGGKDREVLSDDTTEQQLAQSNLWLHLINMLHSGVIWSDIPYIDKISSDIER